MLSSCKHLSIGVSESGRIMAVVSGDQGIQAACAADESLHSYENLAKYLDAVASENEMLANFVRQTIVHDDHREGDSQTRQDRLRRARCVPDRC